LVEIPYLLILPLSDFRIAEIKRKKIGFSVGGSFAVRARLGNTIW